MAREQVLTSDKTGDADKSNFVETELVSMKITLLNEWTKMLKTGNGADWSMNLII